MKDERIISTIIGGLITIVVTILFIAVFTCSCSKDNILPDRKVKDIDGNEYAVEQFGDQMWFTEDLKTTRYNNGENIYSQSDTNTTYTFYMIELNNVCPVGWHVPKDWEWYVLKDYFEQKDIYPRIGNIGHWWTSSTLVEGYESPQAWSWYQGGYDAELHNQVVLKEKYFSVRCIKDN